MLSTNYTKKDIEVVERELKKVDKRLPAKVPTPLGRGGWGGTGPNKINPAVNRDDAQINRWGSIPDVNCAHVTKCWGTHAMN